MIAEILFEAAWKSLLVAPCLVALVMLMKRQSPADRVAVGGFGFAFLTLLPAAVLGVALAPLPSFEVAAPVAAQAMLPVTAEAATLSALSSLPAQPAAASAWSLQDLLLLLWAAGASLILARFASGLATLRQWTSEAEPLDSPAWRSLLRKLDVPQDARLFVSDDVAAPLSWGWQRPVILIDRDTMEDLAEAEAVIAHEAAHLANNDWPRLIAIRTVVSLFWFNPFVWLLERIYLQDVEEAADAQATRLVEPAHYAQVLLNVARNVAVPVGANSISSGSLSKRIQLVLSGRVRSRWERLWRLGALTSVAAIAGPVALVQFVAPAVSAAAEPVLAPVATPAAIADTVAPPAVSAVATPRAAAEIAPLAPIEIRTPIIPPIKIEIADAIRQVKMVAPIAVATATAQAVAIAPTTEIDREEMERIKRASEEIRAQSQIIARDSQKIAERARAQAAIAIANSRKEMMRGADEMDRGAIEMRRGAAQMREEARKLRDPAYRQKVIAEARANQGRWSSSSWNNRVPTDQELIDAIPKMEDGARKMDDGVDKMRDGAAKMRRSAQQQD